MIAHGRVAAALGGLVAIALLTQAADRARYGAAPRGSQAGSATRVSELPNLDQAICARLQIVRASAVAGTASAAVRDAAVIYAGENHAPLWTDAGGHPTADARAAIASIAAADRDGLAPEDYDAGALAAAADVLARAPWPGAADVAAFDVGLSVDFLRFLRELHMGRIDPRALGLRISSPGHTDDFAGRLRAALAAHHVDDAVARSTPALPQYAALRSALATYRSLAAAWNSPPPFAAPAAIHPGQPYADAGRLARRIASTGDLAASDLAAIDPDRYAGALVDGVKRFQARRGLAPDGVIGRATIEALNVPPAARVTQLALALERLRWLPDLGRERIVVINIPMFHLWAWNPGGRDAPALSMAVIVGRAIRTETPVFAEDMRYLIFRPYWDVPASIARAEILPAIARDPGYLAREQMEIVRGAGADAAPVAPTDEAIAALAAGRLRVRQRPGPTNALGLVKFVFPNDADIYMHGTPDVRLFAAARRDFSHGCVRVEDPVALAEWALGGGRGWTRDRILAAMNGRAPQRVDLAAPIRVLLFYTTAVVSPDDGRVHFARDIYGQDARLAAALARRAGAIALGSSTSPVLAAPR